MGNQQTQTYPTDDDDDDDDYFPQRKYVQNQQQLQTHKLRQQKHKILDRLRKIVSFDITPEGEKTSCIPKWLHYKFWGW